MEAGFEFVIGLAIDLFGEIVRAEKPWWVKLLTSLGCLIGVMLACGAILLIAWAIIRAGGILS